MKIKPRAGVAILAMLGILCSSTVATSWAGRLDDRLTELEKHVGTPGELAEKREWRFKAFIGEVMPQLIKIEGEFHIEEQLREVQPEVKVEDVMAFAYEIARQRLLVANRGYVELGYWSKDPELMYGEVSSLAHWFCFILSLVHLKPDDYRREMTQIRPTLSEGTYHRLIVALSLRTPLFEIPAQVLKSQPLPAVEKFLNLQAISMLEEEPR